MKPVRVATTFSRTLHFSSFSRAPATFDSQKLSVVPTQHIERRNYNGSRTHPIHNTSTIGGSGKVRSQCSSCRLSPSRKHGLSGRNGTIGSKCRRERQVRPTDILYAANGQFKIQTTTTTAAAAKELHPRTLPRVNFRRSGGWLA